MSRAERGIPQRQFGFCSQPPIWGVEAHETRIQDALTHLTLTLLLESPLGT